MTISLSINPFDLSQFMFLQLNLCSPALHLTYYGKLNKIETLFIYKFIHTYSYPTDYSTYLLDRMSKVVIAQYCVQDAFIIPDHIDLENKAQVKFWGVKWNRLYIEFVDGTELMIESEGWTQDIDLKYPHKTAIENAEDYGLEPEESEQK